MLRDDLIALGLRSPDKGSTPTSKGDSRPHTPVEHLLTILRDLTAVIELPDDGAFHTSVVECLNTIPGAKDLQTVQAAIDACADACARALARMDRDRLEQKKEIAALLDMVQQAMAIVSGDGHSFSRHLGHTVDRFEALVRIEDVRHLKAELAREVGALREIAAERQKVFENVLQNFNHRVQLLERQLRVTREEATLDPLTRILNRGGFDWTCRQWLA